MLEQDEKSLLCFKEDEINRLLLTNKRLVEKQAGIKISIPFSELVEASLAIQEELKNGILNKQDFTQLTLRDRKKNKYIIKVEKGKPYQGVYQVLHHLVSKNQTR